MRVCNGDLSFACGNIKTHSFGVTRQVLFNVYDFVSPEALKLLFADNAFYFYDEQTNGTLPITENEDIVELRILYRGASACKIIIKLTKGAVDDES